MAILKEIYLAARTRNVADADTENLPVLVVRRDPDIVFSKPLFGGHWRTDRGASGVWRFDVAELNIDSSGLRLELWASGDDAWSPEHVIGWGISGRVGDERVIPLAAFLDLANPVTQHDRGIWVSGDENEGDKVFFLPSVGRGTDATRARRVIVISATDPYGGMFPGAVGPGGDFGDTGTVGPLTVQGGGAGRLFLSYRLPPTPQSDQEHGGAGFYVADLAAPFGRLDLAGGAFTLTIESEDWWVPDYFAVFGADTSEFGPNALIPFVAASAFELRQMSSDPSEGWHTIVLPTAKVLPQRRFPPDIVVEEVEGVLGAPAPHPDDTEPRPDVLITKEVSSES